MLNAAVLTDDVETAKTLQEVASHCKYVNIKKVFGSQIGPYVAAREINSNGCDLFFCDLRDWETTFAVAKAVSAQCPSMAIIGLASQPNAEIERQAASLGAELLWMPGITLEIFESAIERAVHKLPTGMPDNLLVFIPAKAGSGCTTVALNTAGSLRNSFGRRVLLIEADYQSGPLATLVDRNPESALTELLMKADQLDSSLWNESVVRAEGVDLLLRLPLGERTGLPWIYYRQLLRYLKPRYDVILVDLPEVVEDGRTEFLRYARRVYLVCSPDLPALRLAQERCQVLDEQGGYAERVDLVVNRWRKHDLKASDLEKVLARRIVGVFEEDSTAVRGAVLKGGIVAPGTGLGKKFLDFARQLAQGAGAAPAASPRS